MNLRDKAGQILLRRQVSTRWEPVRAFFRDVRERAVSCGNPGGHP